MENLQLDEIIREGENSTIEFKETLSKLDKEMVAFANTEGGYIYVGISDAGVIKGTNISNSLKSQVQDIAQNCDPPIIIYLKVINNVLQIHVPEGKKKPYRCSDGFYKRFGANSQKLSTNEIINLIQDEGLVYFDESINTKAIYPETFDARKLEKFVELSSLKSDHNNLDTLINLNCISQNNNKFYLNNAGSLFFTVSPNNCLPHTEVICATYFGSSKSDILDKKTFSEDIINNINESLIYLQKNLNIMYEIKGNRRREILEIPLVALREAVVNAVCHRDYFDKSSTVTIEVFSDRIEISNPGGLPKNLSPTEFGKRSVARNPLIASLLLRSKYIEKMGTGISRIKKACIEGNVSLPIFTYNNHFTVTFPRNSLLTILIDRYSINKSTAIRMSAILDGLYINGSIVIADLANQLNVSDRAIRKDIAQLTAINLISSLGATRTKRYLLTQSALEIMNARYRVNQ